MEITFNVEPTTKQLDDRHQYLLHREVCGMCKDGVDTKPYQIQKKYCAWCEQLRPNQKPTLLTQTFQQYLEKGNLCSKCSSMITNGESEISKEIREREIIKLETELNEWGELLDNPELEDEKVIYRIVTKMQEIYEKQYKLKYGKEMSYMF